jgi:hypothetical protein
MRQGVSSCSSSSSLESAPATETAMVSSVQHLRRPCLIEARNRKLFPLPLLLLRRCLEDDRPFCCSLVRDRRNEKADFMVSIGPRSYLLSLSVVSAINCSSSKRSLRFYPESLQGRGAMRYLRKDPERESPFGQRETIFQATEADRSIFSSHQLKVCHPLSVDAIGLLDIEREAAAPALEKLAVLTVEVRHEPESNFWRARRPLFPSTTTTTTTRDMQMSANDDHS